MPFPISTRGAIPVPADAASASDEAIILACADQIEHEGARVVSRSKQQLVFRVPVLRGWTNGWWLTVPVSQGHFYVETISGGTRILRYQLSTLRNAVISTLVVGFGFAFVFPRMTPKPPFGWEFAIPAWLWFVGANWVFAAIRVRFWCRKRIANAKVASGAWVGIAVRQPNER